ncbi:protoporphyrinogen oxidase HemJ [Arenibaculum sp.]|uniref:protoporphyrinogen oxidase HemJ n=1 Tax=Arenibaculum sp. TaxID=2865862 RepID=UPI002E125631|nr:protoporphyrinogen oxidase HemJ [Arenibaculum sp.]
MYDWVKAFHVVSIIAWMAGLLYLPRLFVYHAAAEPGSAASETFKVMERRLLRAIMNPAMVATYVFGIWLVLLVPDWMSQGWLHAKLALVLGLTAAHMMMAGWRRAFAEDRNARSQRFFRIANEVPTVLMIAIVILVIVKPF